MEFRSYNVALGLGFAALLYIYLRVSELIYHWCRTYIMLRKLPWEHRPGNTGLLGVPLAALSPRRHALFSDLSKELGKVFYCRLLWIQMVLVSDPVLASEIYNNPRIVKTSTLLYDQFLKLLGGPNGERDIEDCQGGPDDPLHSILRKGLAPSFSIHSVRKGFGVIRKSGVELVDALKARGSTHPVEMVNALMCATLDTIGAFGMQYDMGAVSGIATSDTNNVIQALAGANAYVDALIGNPALNLFPFLRMHKEGRNHIAFYHTLTKKILDQILARGLPTDDDTSIAAQLLRMRDQKGLSTGTLQAQLNVLFWAGHDTTGLTMAWVLFTIVTNPAVEAKVVAELEQQGLLASTAQAQPRTLEDDDIPKLPYLAAVINESMRLIPVTALSGPRVSPKEDVLLSNGLVVPRGTVIWPMVYTVQMHPDNWHEVDRFIPERWLAKCDGGNGEAVKQKSAHAIDITMDLPTKGGTGFLPFSEGRRDCIGKVLANASMMSTLVLLLGNFHFRLADRMGKAEDVLGNTQLRITLQPPDGMWLHAVARA